MTSRPVIPVTSTRVLMGRTDWRAGQHRILMQTLPQGQETEFGFIGAIVGGVTAVSNWQAQKEYAKGAKATASAQIEAARIHTAGTAQLAKTLAPILALGTLGAVFVAIMYAKRKSA